MRGRYNIHALFHGKTVTTESKNLLSEGRFTVIAVMLRYPVFAKKTGKDKNQVVIALLIHCVARTHIG